MPDQKGKNFQAKKRGTRKLGGKGEMIIPKDSRKEGGTKTLFDLEKGGLPGEKKGLKGGSQRKERE